MNKEQHLKKAQADLLASARLAVPEMRQAARFLQMRDGMEHVLSIQLTTAWVAMQNAIDSVDNELITNRFAGEKR